MTKEGSIFGVSKKDDTGEATVTVKVLEVHEPEKEVLEEEEPSYMLEVHVLCIMGDTEEGSLADRWEIYWVHYDHLIEDAWEEYIKRYCPLPDLVLKTAREMERPKQLEGLFAEPEKPQPKPSARERLLARLEAAKEPEPVKEAK